MVLRLPHEPQAVGGDIFHGGPTCRPADPPGVGGPWPSVRDYRIA